MGRSRICKVFDNSPNTAGLWIYFVWSSIHTAQIMVLLVMEMCNLLLWLTVNTHEAN